MPNRTDMIAILIVVVTSFIIPVSMVAYHFAVEKPNPTVYEVRIQEDGGWPDYIAPDGTVLKDTIVAKPGQVLRFISFDVTHSFYVNITLNDGQFEIIDHIIYAGHVSEVTIPENAAVGEYTIYCNVWCSAQHFGMIATLKIVQS